jgi:hypothetical protein
MADYDPAYAALTDGTYGDPFALLGPHGNIVRALLPGAHGVEILSRKTNKTLAAMSGGPLFEATLKQPEPYLLKIDWGGTVQITEDPYSFGLLLSDFDLFLLGEGKHRDMASCLGAQPLSIGDVPGVRFAVWAPNARRVGHRKFQRLGWPPPPDARPHRRHLGNFHPPPRPRRNLQIRNSGPARHPAAQSRPDGAPG